MNGRHLRVCVLAGVLSGCSWFGSTDEFATPGPRLGEVIGALPELALPPSQVEAPSREHVMAAYDRIHGLLPNPREDHAVGKRLADLTMGVAEDRDIAGDALPYAGAIARYERLLEQPEGDSRDQILYQLARAYDLALRSDDSLRYLDRLIESHPDSPHLLEARFRRAEIAFSQGRYAEAAADYGLVVGAGRETPYWQNATYMHGWSEFKSGDLEAGLASFFTVIDSLLPDAGIAPAGSDGELLSDSLRVTTLALGYLDGPATLAQQMRALQRPAWQYLAYQALADDYHARERYLDSVATWQTFIDQNPLDPRAPSAHLGMIDTLSAADFPSEVWPRKESFVRGYGIRSEFWAVHDDGVRAGYRQPLQAFLEELARHSHAAAQQSEEREAFLAAAEWYQELVATFPDDPDTAGYLFLLGEVYTEADEPGQAVVAYQRVVREFPGGANAPEAGYAAILGLERMTGRAAPGDRPALQREKIAAQIEFAVLFSGDPRAAEAQTDAADGLFQLGDHVQAVELAANLLRVWPDVPWRLRHTALGVQGHGHFALGEYAAAEDAYRMLLNGPLDGAQREQIGEGLLAAVYRQGEAAERDGAADLAVGHYLRLAEIAPGAELAIQGHFDAVAVTEAAGETARAAALLASFRSLYRGHDLTRDAAKRLAGLYETSGDLRAAADEYVELAATDADAETRRLALYRAAELYLHQGYDEAALQQFRDYAQRYPEPLEQCLEAVHNVDLLYERGNDTASRRHWLGQKIQIHQLMGQGASERATYLAAQAQLELAQDARGAFAAIRLTHPLRDSLGRKQRALRDAVSALEAVAGYQVAEFTTASTYQMALLFTDLSAAIMASDRPRNLSELEQEQYELLLEEQAFPFEEQAIALHEINMRRSWDGLWDSWIENSFAELGRLMPARFDKRELEVAYVETIH